MRFLLRRLVFYVIALWAAITLNFLLPRLMPGSPLDGLIANYGEQIRSNPQILQQLKASLGSADEPIWQAYPHYLADIATGDFGVSFAKPAPVDLSRWRRVPPLLRRRDDARDACRLAPRWDHGQRRDPAADGAAVVS